MTYRAVFVALTLVAFTHICEAIVSAHRGLSDRWRPWHAHVRLAGWALLFAVFMLLSGIK